MITIAMQRINDTRKHRDALVPVLRLSADNLLFDLSLFDRDGLRQAPLDRITERPMRRAHIEAVIALID